MEGWKEGNGKGSLFLKRSLLCDILHVDAMRCSELLQDATANEPACRSMRVTACKNNMEVLGARICYEVHSLLLIFRAM